MVGVPGRSKGCHTCRKRKIRCGLEKPQCAQCIKSRRICAGYSRDRIFINQSASELQSASPAVAVIKQTPPTSKPTGPNHSYIRTVPREPNGGLPFKKKTQDLTLYHVTPLSLYRRQLTGAYLNYHLSEKKRGAIEETSWFALLSELSSQTASLERSLLAICTARLGRIDHDKALVQKSLALYTEGLRELQKALYDPELMYSDQILGACMALAVYELMECPAGTRYAYASHRNGCARLIQLRGAEAHTSGIGHQMFVSFRLQTILNALDNHRPTYMSEKIWRELPWKYKPKTRFDKLLDIVSEAPAIFRRVDDFVSFDPQNKLIAACAVIKDCWNVDDMAQSFYEELLDATDGPLFWEESSRRGKIQDTEYVNLFPTAYSFPNMEVGKSMVLYWAALTMLWTGMARLYMLVAALGEAGFSAPEVYELPPLEHRVQFITPARNLLQSTEYMLQDKMLGLGPQSIVAPLSIVAETIRDMPEYAREVAWAEEVLDEIRGRGLQILGYLHSK